MTSQAIPANFAAAQRSRHREPGNNSLGNTHADSQPAPQIARALILLPNAGRETLNHFGLLKMVQPKGSAPEDWRPKPQQLPAGRRIAWAWILPVNAGRGTQNHGAREMRMVTSLNESWKQNWRLRLQDLPAWSYQQDVRGKPKKTTVAERIWEPSRLEAVGYLCWALGWSELSGQAPSHLAEFPFAKCCAASWTEHYPL